MIKRVLSKIMDLEISKQNVESANLLSLIKIGGMRYNNLSFSFQTKLQRNTKKPGFASFKLKLFLILSFSQVE